MKLRTYTGLDKETMCACGCNQKILARPDIQVVVDMESFPRKRYLPGHAGNGYGSAPYARREKKEETKPVPSPAPAPPAPVGPLPTPPQPQVEPAPIATPKVVTGVAPSLADNRPWKILQVTISVGDYTSVKAGVADFGRENESLAQLGTRLVAELTNDIKTELDVVHQVQQGSPLSVVAQGAVFSSSTLSAPSGAALSQTPGKTVDLAHALEAYYQRPGQFTAPATPGSLRAMVDEVVTELTCDASAVRTVKKKAVASKWLQNHGYADFTQVPLGKEWQVEQLLTEFGAINEPDGATAESW